MPHERLNLLVIWPRKLWVTKQSPARRHALYALAQRSDVKIDITGPGFTGVEEKLCHSWDDAATGMQNISRIMPDCHAVISYKSLAGCEYGSVRDPHDVSRHLVTLEQANECWPGTTAEFGGVMHPGGGTVVDDCRKAGLRLLVIHHGNDYDKVKAAEETGTRIVHIPHGAGPVFQESDQDWRTREGIILTGSLGNHYPLRYRWKDLIDGGRIRGRYYQRPPNYSESVERSDQLVADYAKAIGSARVVLGCSSRWRYALARHAECALTGAAQVSDLPDDLPAYSEMMHAVDPTASDDVLIAAVAYADEHAQEIGERAQRMAMTRFTTAHYAERLVNVIREML